MAEKDNLRGCSKNTPFTVWGQSFISLAPNDSEIESLNKETCELKEKVRNELLDSTKELVDIIRFINLLCRLGVSYHFEDEIDKHLHRIFAMLPNLLSIKDYDLTTLANLLRVSRQYGYNMSSDVFKKFKGEDGEFKKEITSDVEAVLCLYEACFLAIPGEDILDEALTFTRKHLQVLAENPSYRLQKHIRTALKFPSHRTAERLDAFNYISFYEECGSANETLLKFAKMDYNRLQLHYRRDVALLSKWWINTGLMEKVPFARDRLVESYMWGLGMIFEPQYRLGRMILCKYTQLMTVMDDIYDSFGTLDELKQFTAILQKFTKDAGEELPEYLKFFYRILFEDLETDGTVGCEDNIPERCSYKGSFLKEMIKELVRGYLVEAHWRKGRITPSFDDYVKNGKITCTFDILTSSCLVGMDNVGIKDILWQRTEPDIVICGKLVCRYLNDIAVKTDETDREDFPKALDCYVEQYGVSRDEAFQEIKKLLEDIWKRGNADLLKYSDTIQRIMLKMSLNYARMSEVFYVGTDLFTYASNMKELIEIIFVKPIPM